MASSLIYSNEAKAAYAKRLIGKIMKILYLAEENNNTIPAVYLYALIVDVNSSNNMFDNIFIDVSVKLNALYMFAEQITPHEVIRSRVLEAANMVDRIRKDLLGGNSDGNSER